MIELLNPRMKMVQATPRFFSRLRGRKKFPSTSLSFQLTVGIAIFSILSLGSVTLWTSWRMQQLLVESHKSKIEELAKTFSSDVKLYQEMMSLNSAIHRTIDKPENQDNFIWLRGKTGDILAESDAFEAGTDAETRAVLLSYNDMPLKPKVSFLNGRYWVVCSGPFHVGVNQLGKLYMVNDITLEYKIFLSIVYSLIPATLFAIIILVIIIAWYIRRSLQPLNQINQLAETISVDDLSDCRLKLEAAPSEVSTLANTCNKMLDRLSESWEQQRQFVSNVSHELRTPLTIVQGYLQSTLRRGSNLTQLQREGLEVAASEAERTVRLLQDLLELARADHGTIHYQIEVVVVNDLLSEVSEMAQQFSQGRVHLEPSPNLLKVKADNNRLKQVLLNLIDNAIKYSEPEKPVILKASRKGKQVYISVRDQGSGISLKHQTRIFERFYRVDEARNRAGGTGLGLSIVKTLVEGMGGSVKVRSKPGEGSLFLIILPNASA